jgi:hypothetical protein
MQREREEELWNLTKTENLEHAPSRTAVDPQRLVQRPVERGTVITKLLPEPLLRLGLNEVSRWRADVLPLLTRRGSGARR